MGEKGSKSFRQFPVDDLNDCDANNICSKTTNQVAWSQRPNSTNLYLPTKVLQREDSKNRLL